MIAPLDAVALEAGVRYNPPDSVPVGRRLGSKNGGSVKLDSYGSPEVALLLAASRGDPTREAVRRLMAGPIDWVELIRLAIESHATTGLWHVVSSYPNLPPEAARLHSLAVLNDFRRFHIRSLVARLSSELRQQGIEVMALKGAALLSGGVSQPPLRTMSDIDLLVLKGSPEEAWRLCRANGWTLVDQAWTQELYRDHHHLAPLLDPDGVTVALELHRTLLPGVDRLGVDAGAIIERSRIAAVGNTHVRVPSVEDLLLHACLHLGWANKLRRGAWRAYADAHAIISDPAFSWERFVSIVPTRRARKCCYWTLRIGRVVADLSVPDEVLAQLDPSSGGWMGTLLERHFAAQIIDPLSESTVANRARKWLWFASLGERSISREADAMWNEGAVEAPRDASAQARTRRGPVRAAFATCGYFVRLVSRG